MTELELKKEFAKNLLKYPTDSFKAALQVFPTDTSLALRIANDWPIDNEVLEFKKELLVDNDPLDFLPQSAELARGLWDRMHKAGVSDADYAKLSKEYRETMGWVNQTSKGDSGGMIEAFAEISKRLPV